jgi:4-hydroxyacetophenone monooxygenase
MAAFDVSLRPITADDDTLRAHLASAEVPALLMTVAHLTGDLSILRDDCRPNGWLFLPQGGLSDEVQAQAREAALRVLVRLRDTGAPPPRPTTELIRAITTWAMGADTEELVPLLSEEIALPGEDPKAPGWTLNDTADTGFRVAIVGAGMSGLLAGYRLSQAGVPFVIYEKNSEVGGTWFENTYPGCRVDVPSHLYSYSFAPKLDWPDHFCTRDELLTYFRDFAKESGLHDHIRFDTEVSAAEWDEQRSRWLLTVRAPEGEQRAEYTALVTAVGQLNRPSLPDVPGRESFAGPAFHSAAWDHSVALAGRRVGVIGTGASAFQLIPEIADTVAELRVFQRTPPWLRPTPHYHHPVSPSTRWLYEHVPYYAQWYRFWLFAPGLHGVLEGWIVDPDYPPTEQAISALNDQLRVTLTAAMEAQLTDAPELRADVLPRYPVGAKRVLRDNGSWISTLKRDDVRLVTDEISEITPGGVVTTDGAEHQLDVLVYATGFQASRFLLPMTVTGRGGVDLHEMWSGDARAYLGMTVPGFPNMFFLYGPNTNLSGQGGSIIYFSECAVTHLVGAIRMLLETGHRALEVREDVYEDYNVWVDEGNANRAWGWSKVSSWFINDKGRSAQNWPFTAHDFWKRTHEVDRSAYEVR